MDTDKLNELIGWLTEAAKQTVQVELPALAQDIILIGRIEHLGWGMFSLICCLICARTICKHARRINYSGPEGFPQTMVAALVGMFALLAFSIHSTEALKAWFAPRVYLLEYVADKFS